MFVQLAKMTAGCALLYAAFASAFSWVSFAAGLAGGLLLLAAAARLLQAAARVVTTRRIS